MPAGRPLELRPGEVPWRLRKIGTERAEDAIERAKRMPWWRLLRSRLPTWSGGWWCWPGLPLLDAAQKGKEHRSHALTAHARPLRQTMTGKSRQAG